MGEAKIVMHLINDMKGPEPWAGLLCTLTFLTHFRLAAIRSL
jgi:hypothetical protein